MTTAKPEPSKHLKAGEINFDYIPRDWALTPLKGKRAYIAGWTSQPYSIDQIKSEFEQGKATGIGLITGQWSNEGGLVWVDIDGPAAIKDLEELAGGPLSAAFPPTLTISSGKEARQRMLFSISAKKLSILPDKATIKIGVPSFEILFRSRQGAIMGSHPDTDGYFTTPHGGFEYAKNPPELPEWLYEAIAKAYPLNKYKKPLKEGILTQQVNIEYEEGSEYQQEVYINDAKIYLDHLNLERVQEYDSWVKVGMCLKQVDDALLTEWIDWSKQTDNFEEGACERKWNTFEVVEGGPSPENHCGLHHLRAMAKEDGYVDVGGFVVETGKSLKEKAKKLFETDNSISKNAVDSVLSEILGGPSDKELNQISQKIQNKGRPKTPPASELAEYVTQIVIECGWRYDPKYDTFMFYQSSKGTWRREEYRTEYKHFVQDLFLRENIPTPGGFTSHLLSDVVNLTQAYITQPYWNDDPDKLAFRNGVLEMSTKEFLPHDQENYLTWGLDFDYDPHANSGPIIQWLRKTQYNDEERVQVLRAWLKACLVGKGHELQRFLEVIGPGGRGKSTFANHLKNNHDFEILSFGEPVKRHCKDIFGLENKNREIIQDFAQKVKEIDFDVWVKYLTRKLDSLEKKNIVIDDLRFPNEYTVLKDRGFFFIKLEISKPLQIQRIKNLYKDSYKTHIDRLENISESYVDTLEADYTIDIGTDSVDIKHTIANILKKLNKNN